MQLITKQLPEPLLQTWATQQWKRSSPARRACPWPLSWTPTGAQSPPSAGCHQESRRWRTLQEALLRVTLVPSPGLSSLGQEGLAVEAGVLGNIPVLPQMSQDCCQDDSSFVLCWWPQFRTPEGFRRPVSQTGWRRPVWGLVPRWARGTDIHQARKITVTGFCFGVVFLVLFCFWGQVFLTFPGTKVSSEGWVTSTDAAQFLRQPRAPSSPAGSAFSPFLPRGILG